MSKHKHIDNPNVRRMVKAIDRAERAWAELHAAKHAYNEALEKLSDLDIEEVDRRASVELRHLSFGDLGA